MDWRRKLKIAALLTGAFAARAGLGAEPAGKLVSSSGQIVATSPSKAPRPLKAGDAVLEGDTIRSAASSSAKFLMNDQTILDLNPSSQLLVEHYERKVVGDRNVAISVLDGTVRASVTKHLAAGGKFVIRTRTATMGVRGTEFVVQNDLKSGQSQLTVLKGLVQAAPNTKGAALVGVSPGNQFTVLPGAPPQLVKLNPDQLAALFQGATVRDLTFASAVEIKRSSSRSGSAATASALSAAREAGSRSPASRSAGGAASVSIPGNTDSLHNLRDSSAALLGRTVKLNVVFTK
jgi:hypothetical protein